MVIRKLRAKRGWSQEQLADFSGLNVRTIQRVESGQKASMETLLSIAAVFEVDVSTLTEEITVIDKSTEEWKQLPWWFRFNMFGINSRRKVLIIEFILLAVGLVTWAVSGDVSATAVSLLAAYLTGWIIRYGDDQDVW